MLIQSSPENIFRLGVAVIFPMQCEWIPLQCRTDSMGRTNIPQKKGACRIGLFQRISAGKNMISATTAKSAIR